MSNGDNKRPSKADELPKKILGRGFTFDGNQTDLKLLHSIHAGMSTNTKPGDLSFHAYAAAFNVANDIASQALDILELIPFNNQLADVQQEYTSPTLIHR